jgi:thiamine phosphate synthase YjbQ (UPF0047 family)
MYDLVVHRRQVDPDHTHSYLKRRVLHSMDIIPVLQVNYDMAGRWQSSIQVQSKV